MCWRRYDYGNFDSALHIHRYISEGEPPAGGCTDELEVLHLQFYFLYVTEHLYQ